LRRRKATPSGICPAAGGDQAAGFGSCRILPGEQERTTIAGQFEAKGATMSTTPATLSREALVAAPQSYFGAVDAMDVDAVLAHFADDATMTVQTDHVTFEGAAEIRRMFTDFFANSKTIRHDIRNIVVEEAAGKVATEQGYIGELQDGSLNDMHNCNFFDFDADGKFKRVFIWMAGTNPLH
jgi:ketosteroid isomerase-like protein